MGDDTREEEGVVARDRKPREEEGLSEPVMSVTGRSARVRPAAE
jgi:hypothetical protein